MPQRSHVLGTAAIAAACLAAPAAASAVTVAVDRPCYTHVPTQSSQPIVATLTGGTPGAPFLVAATVPGKGTGSAGSASGTFDAAGNGTAQITDVSPPSGTIGPTRGQAITLSVQDFGAGGVDTPFGQTLVTNLAISIASKPRSPRARRTVSVSGSPFAGRSLSAFVVKGSSTHVLRRIPLGKANVCGFASAKGVVAPRSFKTGTYRLYVNAGSKLDKPNAVFTSFRIFRTSF